MISYLLFFLTKFIGFLLVPKQKRLAHYMTLLLENRVLKRSLAHHGHRPRFTDLDRSMYVRLLELFSSLRSRITLVSPETVLDAWKKRLASFWTYSGDIPQKPGRPPISKTIRDLIIDMKQSNVLWGAFRIVGELSRLGFDVSKSTVIRTIATARKKGRIKATGAWKTFLSTHWNSLYSCDFFTVDTFSVTRYYVFFIEKLSSRKIVQWGITRYPTKDFVTNQLKGFMYDRLGEETYLIHDNSGELRHQDYRSLGIQDVSIMPFSPDMNSYAERLVGSVRREILDHLIIFNHRQLQNVISSYVDYYNNHRPHQGIDNAIPNKSPPVTQGPVKTRKVIFGLYTQYYRDAA